MIMYTMVLIKDGNSEHNAYVWRKIGNFREKKIGYDDSFDVFKCLQEIESPDLFHMCA